MFRPGSDQPRFGLGAGLSYPAYVLVKLGLPRDNYCFIDPGIAAVILVRHRRRLVYLANMISSSSWVYPETIIAS
jgi:hypothetical protein